MPIESIFKNIFNGFMIPQHMTPDSLENKLVLLSRAPTTKPFRFFDLDNDNREWPSYEKALERELDAILNVRPRQEDSFQINRPPFRIISAKRTAGEGKMQLELHGTYETYDGVTVEVNFQGTYGDPKDVGILSPELEANQAFSAYALEARLLGADARQQDTFSRLIGRDSDIRFRNGSMHCRVRDGKFSFSDPALNKIHQIGKLVAMYDGAHIREVIQEITAKRAEFLKTLKDYGECVEDVEISIKELVTPQERLDSIIEVVRSQFFEYVSTVNFAAYKSYASKHPVLQGKEAASVSFSYDTMLFEDWGLWEIRLSWKPFFDILGLLQHARINHMELPANVQKTAGNLQFILDALGFQEFNPHDSRTNMYCGVFDEALLKAREEQAIVNPDYRPLIQTREESNLRVEKDSDYGQAEELMFKSLTAYRVFDALILAFENNPLGEAGELARDKEVQHRLDCDPVLKKRFMTFFDCYNRDPCNAWKLYRAMDPVLNRAEELEDAMHVQLSK